MLGFVGSPNRAGRTNELVAGAGRAAERRLLADLTTMALPDGDHSATIQGSPADWPEPMLSQQGDASSDHRRK